MSLVSYYCILIIEASYLKGLVFDLNVVQEYGLKMDIDDCKKGIEEIADVLDDLAKVRFRELYLLMLNYTQYCLLHFF